MKFSIITPVRNMERWIAETIESVLSQEGDFEIEYIIQDGGSTDKTLAIIDEYKSRIENGTYPVRCKKVEMRCFSEKDSGQAEAINRGFAKATGDIYAWINADDVYEPGAFGAVKKTLEAYPEIQWLKGITSTIDENSKRMKDGSCKLYRWDWLSKGIYGREAYFIEQDSVFWRAELWKKISPIPAQYRIGGDYWIWMQFAKYARLWPINFPISRFRKSREQLSRNVSGYRGEQELARPRRDATAWKARLFFSPQSRISGRFPGTQPFFLRIYPKFFMLTKKERVEWYIELENGTPAKKRFKTYVAEK